MNKITVNIFSEIIFSISFAFVEILILSVAINNIHYSIYFGLLGAAGFFFRHRSLEIMKTSQDTNIIYKVAGVFAFIVLIIGCLALIANISLLLMKKFSL